MSVTSATPPDFTEPVCQPTFGQAILKLLWKLCKARPEFAAIELRIGIPDSVEKTTVGEYLRLFRSLRVTSMGPAIDLLQKLLQNEAAARILADALLNDGEWQALHRALKQVQVCDDAGGRVMTTSSAGMEARKAATKQKPKPKRQTSPHKASTLAEPPYTSPLLLTVEESAQKLRICRDFVYRLLARGEIHSVKIGRARRIPLRELEAYIERLSAA